MPDEATCRSIDKETSEVLRDAGLKEPPFKILSALILFMWKQLVNLKPSFREARTLPSADDKFNNTKVVTIDKDNLREQCERKPYAISGSFIFFILLDFSNSPYDLH